MVSQNPVVAEISQQEQVPEMQAPNVPVVDQAKVEINEVIDSEAVQ